MSLKVTTWNIEHAQRLITDTPSNTILDRRQRIYSTIKSINPDILCIQEGPKGEQAITDFCNIVLNQEWVPVLLKGPNDTIGDKDREYKIRGTQWIWFLTRQDLLTNCRIQSPTIWKSFVGHDKWPVNYWGKITTKNHSHYRHPQVMIYKLDQDQEIEIIGVHLKSKINMNPIIRDAEGNLIGEYPIEATEARIKLATEARNVREYIARKFEQLANPGIIVLGDCNDGAGQDYFEKQYLFFDLISNLQGDVMLSERFFNHALFDYANHLRWTAKFEDEILEIEEEDNPLLLDHILMSQPLCREQFPIVANEYAGKVEHEPFERYNAGATSNAKTSDHRPVSCEFDPTENS